MASSRRRFLMHAAAMGGAALARPAEALATSRAAAAGPAALTANTFSPPELLARHAARARAAAASRAAQSDDADYAAMYRDRRNWGRWGANDQVGAINTITAEKRAAAARLVRTGRTVSLSRVFEPPQHFMTKSTLGSGGGYVMDYLGFIYHGNTITHIDALCHIWDGDGMWQGRDHNEEITTQGAHFADITNWKDGIITKGVLLDVPRHRGEPYVTADAPVRGDELEAIARAQGVSVEAGDALLVHSPAPSGDGDGMWQGRDHNEEITTQVRPLRRHHQLEGRHHHEGRPARRPASSRRAVRDGRCPGARR